MCLQVVQKQKQKSVFKIYNAQFSLMDPSPKPSMILSLHVNKQNQKLFDTSNGSQWHLHLFLLHAGSKIVTQTLRHNFCRILLLIVTQLYLQYSTTSKKFHKILPTATIFHLYSFNTLLPNVSLCIWNKYTSTI
jgi:hypothetical protein